jgi:hypothetical protein
MAADQNRNKKPTDKAKRDNSRNAGPAGKSRNSDDSLHRPYEGYDEEEGSKTDYSQQIGEFSNWSKSRTSWPT